MKPITQPGPRLVVDAGRTFWNLREGRFDTAGQRLAAWSVREVVGKLCLLPVVVSSFISQNAKDIGLRYLGSLFPFRRVGRSSHSLHIVLFSSHLLLLATRFSWDGPLGVSS